MPLHGNIVCRKCNALVYYKDGKCHLEQMSLVEGGRFSLSEMRKMQIDANPKIKNILFVKAFKQLVEEISGRPDKG